MNTKFNLFRINDFFERKNPNLSRAIVESFPFVSEEDTVFVLGKDLSKEENEALQEEYFVGNITLSRDSNTAVPNTSNLSEVEALSLCKGYTDKDTLYIFSKRLYEEAEQILSV